MRRALAAVIVCVAWSAPAAAGWFVYVDENGTPVVTDTKSDPRQRPYEVGDFERRALQQEGVPHRGEGAEIVLRMRGAPADLDGRARDRAAAPREARYDDLIAEASSKYGVPFALVKAVIAVESAFRPTVRSRAGATGLMQLMPATAKELGVEDATDPRQNVFGGTRYLAALLKHFKSEELALAAYNAGPGRVMRAGGIPPFDETRAYVRNVLGLAEVYGSEAPRPALARSDRLAPSESKVDTESR